jgi:hypothetical protein
VAPTPTGQPDEGFDEATEGQEGVIVTGNDRGGHTRDYLAPHDRGWPDDLLVGYRPSEWWHGHPATEAQIEALMRRGWSPPPGLTKGEASHALDRPSRRQREVLSRRGLWELGMSFEQAREVLDGLARDEGWGR